jgi:eukaryotic-like serine/threonine-protein kinase
MQVLCPNCSNSIALGENSPRAEVQCPSCGSSFRVEPEATTEWRPPEGRQQIGRFQILETVGVGAFGTVYRARDPELDRVVAIKVPRAGSLSGPQDLDRFQREARSVAQLRHPGIVPVHEVGTHEGLPYLVSDFVKGITLADLMTGKRPPAQEAARLIADIADILQYAHENGVIHRDVKPSNILLGADGRPHLMDFGLAKRDAGDISMTMDGQVLGTPAYMSPEQARGEAKKVDGRSDIYSVGVILYQLLTGELPFRGNTRMLLHQVLHDEPRAPRSLNDSIPRDLQTICQKTMSKEPRRRYQTAGELAEDLRRFLRGDPILARPVSSLERLQRWMKRNPAVAALSAALLIVFVAGFAGVLWKWLDAESARASAEREAEVARQARQDADLAHDEEKKQRIEAEKARTAADLLRATAEKAREDADHERANAERSLYFNRVALADRYRLANNITRAEELLDACPPDARQWEWHFLKRLCQQSELVIPNTFGGMRAVAFSPDGKRVASGVLDVGFRVNGVVKIWDAQTGKLLTHLRGHGDVIVSIAFSPDGERIATGSLDETVRIWDAGTGRELHNLQAKRGFVNGVSFDADGRRLASAHAQGKAVLWDAATGKKIRELTVHDTEPCVCVAFHPDGKHLATGIPATTIKIWDADKGAEVTALKGEAGGATSVAFSPQGDALASGHVNGSVVIWQRKSKEAQDWYPKHTLRAHAERVTSVAFSPDGTYLASAGWDHLVRVWDAAKGGELDTLRGHTEAVQAVAFSRSGDRLASVGDDSALRLWPARGKQRPIWLDDAEQVVASPNGLELAVAGRDKKSGITLWDLRTGGKRTLKGHAGQVTGLAYDAAGRQLVSCGSEGTINIWDISRDAPGDAPPRSLKSVSGGFSAVAVSPDGNWVAGGDDDAVNLWDARSGQVRHTLRSENFHATRLAFDAQGTRLAIARDGVSSSEVQLWQVPDGNFLKALYVNVQPVHALTFALAGDKLVVGGGKGSVQIWDPSRGIQLGALTGHSGIVASLTFSPDGRRLVSVANELKIWDLDAEQEILTLAEPARYVRFGPEGRRLIVAGTHLPSAGAASAMPHLAIWDGGKVRERLLLRDAGHAAALSPNGKYLVSAGVADTILLWEASTGRKLQTWKAHVEPVRRLAFAPDSDYVASASEDNTIRVWYLPAGKAPITCAGHTDWVVHVGFSPDGKRLASAGYDNTARVWNARTGALTTTFGKHRERVLCAAFAPDNNTVASAGDDKKIRLWNATTGEEQRVLEGHDDSVNGVAFSRDGKWLASASDDLTVKIWNLETGAEVRSLTGHHDYVRDVAFSPDGRFVASAGWDGIVHVWNAESGAVVLRLQRPGGLRSVSYGPGGLLATAGENLAVRVWETLPLPPR